MGIHRRFILLIQLLGFGVFGEAQKFGTFQLNSYGLMIVSMTCIIGLAISYAGMNCRNLLSATAFTVVGVLNKMGTVLVNSLIWDKHVSLPIQGLLFINGKGNTSWNFMSFYMCGWWQLLQTSSPASRPKGK